VTVYVGLLRGVNVGGHHKIPMTALRDLAEGCGFDEVRTYIQSGNLVFRAPKRSRDDVAATLRTAIEERFGFAPAVVVRTEPELAAVVADNPFAGRISDHRQLHVQFLAADDPRPNLEPLDRGSYAPEEVAVRGDEIYLYLPNGMGRSKLAVDVVRRAKGVGTARNWRTVTILLEMARATGG
jgi:uncharacterized protein (DUF1697 family)